MSKAKDAEGRAPAGRCQAVTWAGTQCKWRAEAGETLCHIHGERGMTRAGSGRRCTAMVGERQCRGWALPGSKAALCYSHARRGRHRGRCEARTREGKRCGNWVMGLESGDWGLGRFCVVHGGLTGRPEGVEDYVAREGEGWVRVGCGAMTRAGRRCRQWAMRNSDPPRCRSHGGPMRYQAPGAAERAAGRQCTAMTLKGERCRRWVWTGTGIGDWGSGIGEPALCWIHTGAGNNGRLSHGYYRRTSYFTRWQAEAIARVAREAAPLTAEILLMRLKLRGMMAFLGRAEAEEGAWWRTTGLALDAVRTVARLLKVQQEMEAAEVLAPSTGGGVGKLLEGIVEKVKGEDRRKEEVLEVGRPEAGAGDE